ncbi:50S ribosomal protein L35ae [Candidatus Pacearchaeota archaeon]|nr:50S ribosomal protein L35ae [Candidatus Pacearchaeota archaeon]
MKGKVIQFRRGRKTIHERHFIIEALGVTSKESATKLIGKEVSWVSPGKNKKIIKGKVSGTHGNKGLVRVIFEKGLPGQAITTNVEVKD